MGKINIDVHFTPVYLDEMQLKDRNIVVIDVLRASTTIATALHNGAREIIPVSSIENAVKISGNLFGDVTLRAGERNARMIEGFNLGNSPREYSEEIVKGKSIIFVTTNGSAAIVKGKHARHLVVAGFVNMLPVVTFLNQLQADVTIICAGKENRFCIEDAVCAGRLINELERVRGEEMTLDDGGLAASVLDRYYGTNLLWMLENCDHGKYLAEIGYADDLQACAVLNQLDIVPTLYGNVIRAPKKT